jgi:hypothetical protein
MMLLLLYCGVWRIDLRFSILGSLLGLEVGIFFACLCFPVRSFVRNEVAVKVSSPRVGDKTSKDGDDAER